MSRIWQSQPREVLQSLIDAIQEEASDDLNDWETHFIADIAIRIANGWSITENQERKLESIYAEKTK
jgi:hypothetical protein